VAPIFTGSGQQNKILEALAMQVPVVTTSQVAAGISASSDVLMIADTPTEFQNCIKQLFNDKLLYEKYQHNGRSFVVQHFSWEAATMPLSELLSIART
jgi:glycosyltransferase involved in cell wall biosynthesis